MLRRFWYPVIPFEQVAAGPKPFTLLGEKIVLWVDGSGRVSALDDRCCHRTAQLSRGFYENGSLVCGYHGWSYNCGGQCIQIPQMPERPVSDRIKVRSYGAAVRYGYVWVCLSDEPLTEIPEIPEASAPGFRMIQQFYEPWNCAGLRLMENSFDPAHVNFVHRGTFGDQADAGAVQMNISDEDDWGFTMNTKFPVKNSSFAKGVLRTDSEKTFREVTAKWWMPFARTSRFAYPNGLVHSIFTAATPIDDARSMVCQFAWRNDTETDVKAADIVEFDRQVTAEDRHILEATDHDVPLSDRTAEISMGSDRPGVLMRQKLLRLLTIHGEEEATGKGAAGHAAFID
jgi:Phenylpropionate dioxygenase and related ring-hydroxylating dioxygenases, large terminal subunit